MDYPVSADSTKASGRFPRPSVGALVGVALFAALVATCHLVGEQRWVPLLDSFDLALHEAGHPIVGLFSERLSVYGGTLFQLAFPVMVLVHFWRRRHPASAAVAGVWLGANFLNIARYMADARAQELPLVGSGEHDWTEIFSRWGVLAADTRIAAFTAFLGWLTLAGTCIALLSLRRRGLS